MVPPATSDGGGRRLSLILGFRDCWESCRRHCWDLITEAAKLQ
jgi:hypothetical protein